MMQNEIEMETALSDAAQHDTERQVLTPCVGRETTGRTMTGMMQEMMQGAEQTRRRRILGTVDMLRSMDCDNDAIRRQLTENYGVSPAEADSILFTDQL
ncbi:MAG: hypothetical protein IJM51_05910 [Clostridia bacterium]|nr:hypothetical protein [Clostridia bacterium]